MMMDITMVNCRMIALSGHMCRGKSTALFAFGILGTKYMSLDHLIAKKYTNEFPDYDTIADALRQEVERCRSYGSGDTYVFEVPVWILNKTADLFDEILVIDSCHTSTRQHIRNAMAKENVSYPGITLMDFTPTKTILNDGSKIDLWKQVEDWLIELNRVDWTKHDF